MKACLKALQGQFHFIWYIAGRFQAWCGLCKCLQKVGHSAGDTVSAFNSLVAHAVGPSVSAWNAAGFAERGLYKRVGCLAYLALAASDSENPEAYFSRYREVSRGRRADRLFSDSVVRVVGGATLMGCQLEMCEAMFQGGDLLASATGAITEKWKEELSKECAKCLDLLGAYWDAAELAIELC